MPTYTVEWKGCHAKNFRPMAEGNRVIRAIVLHIMDGSLSGTDSWFNNEKAGVSSHLGIGHKGEIHRYVQDKDIAFHAGVVVQPSWPLIHTFVGNPNDYTLGIEHEGKATDETFPEEQLNASAGVVAALCTKYKIPIDPLHIIGHHEIKASKPCPSSLPRDYIIAQAVKYAGQIT